MITLEKIRREISSMLQQDMSWVCLEKLSLLLQVEHRLCQRGAEDESAFDMEKADAWAAHMQNSDGSRGAHWSAEQTNHLLAIHGYDLPAAEFYAVINSLWSDFGTVARNYGVDREDFWAEMAKSWICDSDAVEDKAAKYYADIVRHD